MLPCMLLHVVETAWPIQFAPDGGARRQGLNQNVGHPLALIDHIGYLYPLQPPGIVELASGRGIESSAVQINPSPLLGSLHDGSLEAAQMGVQVVEPLRHGSLDPEVQCRPNCMV